MEISRKSCRLCLTETEFNVSLFGSHCRKTNMVDKIYACVKLVIEESDYLNTICYKCADNIERYYEFIVFVRKSQSKLDSQRVTCARNIEGSPQNVNRRVTSYVREQIYDADYTFSFLEMPNAEEKKETKPSSPFFSYFSPNAVKESVWKTPQVQQKDSRKRFKTEKPGQHSRDLFESQSQDVEETEFKTLDWKLTPEDNIIKRVRDKLFGRSEF